MNAIVVKQFGGPEALSYEDMPIPSLGAGQALVRITAAGVNFIDVYHRMGKYEGAPPFIVGNEAAGVIEALAPDARGFKVGERVAYCNVRGSYADYAAVPVERLVPVPDSVDDQTAAAVLLQGMTAHYLSRTTYPLRNGDDALVHAAAGGVGLLLTQMARRIGARVIATVSTDEKAKLAREAGADDVILYTKQDFERETRRLTADAGVHVVYDSVGKTTFEKGLNVLRRRGMMVSFGQSSGNAPAIEPLRLIKGSLFLTRPTLIDYVATTEELRERAADVFGMVERHELHVRVAHVYKLADAANAHRDLEARKTTGKLVLLP
ncbi:MAG TPA: quinone oxidoreductase [Candidatus Eremiobacteraceae bacterium]|jgi:NADPH2:quinone reductase|nr:quinone oxidoreductase [Candidatus Eremiobacteraceae bacterium]